MGGRKNEGNDKSGLLRTTSCYDAIVSVNRDKHPIVEEGPDCSANVFQGSMRELICLGYCRFIKHFAVVAARLSLRVCRLLLLLFVVSFSRKVEGVDSPIKDHNLE